jgi:tetratricopeptide (TPR) repeat protein
MTQQFWYCFEPFKFDGRLLYCNGAAVDIQEREARILHLLIEAGQHGVPGGELLNRVCGSRAHPDSLYGAVWRLRKLLRDADSRQSIRRESAYIEREQQRYVFGRPIRVEYPPCAQSIHEYNIGLQRWNEREPDALWQAKDHFDLAVKRDPAFGAAYAARADCYAILGSYSWIAPRTAAAKAKAAAKEALAFDDDLAQPHATLGLVSSLFERNWSSADVEFARAIERDPKSGTARHWRAMFRAAIDDPWRAIEEIGVARGCEPNSRIIEAHAGAILYWSRQFDAAEQHCERTIGFHPRFWYAHHLLGLVFEQQGRVEQALAKQRKAVECYESASLREKDSPLLLSALARAYALAGARREALLELKRVRAARTPALFHTATAYAALGEHAAAFHCLASACEQRDVWTAFLAVDPRLDPLRADPRFAALRAALNLKTIGGKAHTKLRGRRLGELLQRLEL